MKLSIVDMRALLKTRSAEVTGKKAPDDAAGIIAGVNDVQVILDEMKKYAMDLAATEEQLRNEQQGDSEVSK
jgi:hypothetical protein